MLCDQHMALVVNLRHTTPDGAVVNHPMHQVEGPRFGVDIVVDPIGRHELVVEAWIDHATTLQSRIDRKLAAGLEADLDERRAGRARSARERRAARRAVHRRRRPSGRRVRRLVRVLPRSTVTAEGADDRRTPRHAGGRDRPPAVRRRPRLRHRLPPADPPDRHVAPQGGEQLGHRRPRRRRQPVGDRRTRGRARRRAPAARHARRRGRARRCGRRPRPRGRASTSPSSAARTTRGSPTHPDWFHVRPDGSIAYAENPPKRYQDIVPLAFDTPAWASLWEALADTIRVWRRLGVRTFRVDNPHTKPLAFWEWAITELKRDDPGLIFLAEAFAHPHADARAVARRLHPVVHPLPVAARARGSCATTTRRCSAARRSSTSAARRGRTRPTSSPPSCSRATARRSSPASSSPPR